MKPATAQGDSEMRASTKSGEHTHALRRAQRHVAPESGVHGLGGRGYDKNP